MRTIIACFLGLAAMGHAAGIAAKYPGDKDIGSDSNVIFADDFEGYKDAKSLSSNWNAGVYHHVKLSRKSYAGKQALEFLCPKQDEELSNTVARLLSPEEDQVYLRCYTMYDRSFDVLGSSHNGMVISAHYYTQGAASPGIKADGKNKFLVSMEAGRDQKKKPNPGSLNAYVYHPEQRSEWGDHFYPTGVVYPFTYLPGEFGPSFVPMPEVTLKLGKWYCLEMMVKANQPGKRDGQITFWVDGEVVADFLNLRLRDIDTLKIDRVDLSLHIKRNSSHETRKWYDNVVVARSYIGPMVRAGR